MRTKLRRRFLRRSGRERRVPREKLDVPWGEARFVSLAFGALLATAIFLLHLRQEAQAMTLCCRTFVPPSARHGWPVERCPHLELTSERVVIDGFRVTEGVVDGEMPALTERLREMRKVDEMIHPDFVVRCVNVDAHPRVPMARVLAAMRSSARAGYHAVALIVELGPMIEPRRARSRSQ
jgi:hypothetical protein